MDVQHDGLTQHNEIATIRIQIRHYCTRRLIDVEFDVEEPPSGGKIHMRCPSCKEECTLDLSNLPLSGWKRDQIAVVFI